MRSYCFEENIMKIYFMRHGETDWNRMEKIQGRIDNPLNTYGQKQAAQAKEVLKDVTFTHVYASTLSRAIETATIVTADQALQIMQDARLLERDFGVLEGQAHEAYYTYEETGEMPESVETKASIYERVNDFFTEMVKQHQMDDVILVSAHAHTIRTLVEKTFPDNFSFSTRLYNCQAVQMNYDGQTFSFVGITDKVEVEEA